MIFIPEANIDELVEICVQLKRKNVHFNVSRNAHAWQIELLGG